MNFQKAAYSQAMGARRCGTFIHAYDACKGVLKPVLEEARTAIAEGLRSQKSAPRWAPLPSAGRADWRSSTPEHSDPTKTRKNMPLQAPQRGSHA